MPDYSAVSPGRTIYCSIDGQYYSFIFRLDKAICPVLACGRGGTFEASEYFFFFLFSSLKAHSRLPSSMNHNYTKIKLPEVSPVCRDQKGRLNTQKKLVRQFRSPAKTVSSYRAAKHILQYFLGRRKLIPGPGRKKIKLSYGLQFIFNKSIYF